MKRLVVIVLPLLVVPLVGLSFLAWTLAGQAEDQLAVTQRKQHGDMVTLFAFGLDNALDRVAGEFRHWAEQLSGSSLAIPPPARGQLWTTVFDEQGRWWHPAIYAVHFFKGQDSDGGEAAAAEQLAQAGYQEQSGGSAGLAAEAYEALDRAGVPQRIRAQAVLGLSRCLRKLGDAQRSAQLYRRMREEFNEVVDETGMNFGAEASAAYLAMSTSAGDEGEVHRVWRENADALLAGLYPMSWALMIGHLTNALAMAPADLQQAEDAVRLHALRRMADQLRAMSEGAAVVEARDGSALPRLQMVGGRLLLVEPAPISKTAGWVIVGFGVEWAGRELLGPIVAELNAKGVGAVFVRDEANQVVAGNPIVPEAVSMEMSLARWGLPWTLSVGFADLAGLHAQAMRRHLLLTGSIALLAVVMAVGVVLGGRMMRREIELSRLKSEFVDNVSHELRTPVTSIKLFSELLHGGHVGDGERQREYYRLLASESDRLARMVENMLNFSRIVAGKMQLRRQPTDMAEYLSELLRPWQMQAQPTGHHVRLHMGSDLPICDIDREAMSRAIANLVANAIKYSSDEREILVMAQRRDRTVSISVRDRGIGISPADLPHVFERFYRVRNSQGDHVQGTGLGLTIVKDIVERHGGTVQIDSRLGQGTVVELFLPTGQGGKNG